MAKDTENTGETDGRKQRKPQGPRPLHVLYQTGADGDLEIVHVTRDANEVIDMIQERPNVKHKKVDAKIGR